MGRESLRLTARLIAIVLLLSVLPSAALGLLAVRTLEEVEDVRPEEALTREATALATYVGSWMEARADALVGWYGVWDLEDRERAYQVGLLRAIHRAVPAAVTVALVDAAGRPAVPAQFLDANAAPPGRTPGSEARAAALLARAPASSAAAGATVGEPYVPPAPFGQDDPVVPVVVRRAGVGARLLAEVSLAGLAAGFTGDAEHGVALLDGERRPVLGGDQPLVTVIDPRLGVDLGAAVSLSWEDRGQALRGAAAAVPGTDWVVVVVEPAVRSTAAVARLRARAVGVLAVLFVATGLLAVTLEGTLVRAVRELAAAAHDVAAGVEGRRVDIVRGDELGELAAAFNHMSTELATSAAALRAKTAEVEAFNRELVDRVAARTAELEAAQAEVVRASQLAAVAEVGAGLAHELNNPVAAILGGVQLMAARGRYDAELIAGVERSAERCREVLGTMLRFAQGEVDRASAPVVDLHRIVRENVALNRSTFTARGVDVALDAADGAMGFDAGAGDALGEDRALSRIDPAFASQVLQGVLDALVAGLPAGSEVTLSLWPTEAPDGPSLRLEVRGDAVTPGAAPRDDDRRAAGLRLWTARRILALVGGRLDAHAPHGPWRVVFPGV